MTIGCGKKAEDASSNKPESRQDTVVTDTEAELAKQELFCGGAGGDCPTYITKIAVLQKTKLKFCTGFLTKDNVVVTASSCLPDRLRMNGVACDKDITFFFANKNPSAKPLRVKCESVLESTNVDSTKEPFLWRSDVVYLKVDESDPKIKKDLTSRRRLTPSRTGLSDNLLEKDIYIWSVDQIDSAQPGSYQGIIRKNDECRVVHNSYFNPLSSSASSPVITLAGCQFNEGNSGAPVLDLRGKVRGIISRPIDQKEIDEANSMRILENPLKPFMHITNYACAPIYNSDETVQNENECNRQLDINIYDAGQTQMVNEASLFRTPVQKMEAYLNEKSRYFKFKVQLTAAGDGQQFKVTIDCFKNATKWLPEFTTNNYFLSYIDIAPTIVYKKMDVYGKIFAKEVADPEKETVFQFKPSFLRKNKQTSILMWSDGPTTQFNSVPISCPESLL